MMYATICPAHCIHIEAGERENPASRSIEKYPIRFDIDELVCVETCPCDALRMDSQQHIKPVEHRHHAVLGKAQLTELGNISIAVDGGSSERWREQYRLLGDLRQVYRPDDRFGDAELGYRAQGSNCSRGDVPSPCPGINKC